MIKDSVADRFFDGYGAYVPSITCCDDEMCSHRFMAYMDDRHWQLRMVPDGFDKHEQIELDAWAEMSESDRVDLFMRIRF